jgi:alpha-L-rhamnosidase
VAIALHSHLRHTGSFSCSNPLVNQLQHNIEWSLNSNVVEIPTDVDERAERLGWTGDAQIIFPTMAFNRDVHRLFRKWLEDLALEQGSNGAVPVVVPDLYTPMKKGPKRGWAGWGDASTIVPMDLFETYGDTAILQQQYPSMLAWVKYEIGQLDPNDHLLKDWTYGDWLAMGPQTGDVLIDQCYLIHSIELLLQARNVLGISDHDGPMLEATLQDCKKAFQTAFICKDGLLSENTQTACAMALAFDLLPDSLQPVVVKQLVNLIRETNDHLATGFLGTTYILQALSNHGQLALAYTLLEQETMPSWLYFVKQGATTLWEEWDAKNLNGGLCKCSFNQYAFGVVGAWLYSTVAGIRALSPGYQRILIEPHPGGDLTWAKGSYQCRYGTIVSEWKLNGVEIQLHVEIPPGTEAVIRLPGKKDITVPGGSYDYTAVIN